MSRVLASVHAQHDLRLVLIAILICILASTSAFWTFRHARGKTGRDRFNLILLTGIFAAVGMWTTHYVATLAYDPGMPVGYDPGKTFASFGIALAAATAGFLIMSLERRIAVMAGGAIIGLGISAMHFTGMQAIGFAGRLEWDNALATAAIISGVLMASAAAVAHFELQEPKANISGPVLLVLAICTMHFTAMAAVTFAPDPTIPTPEMSLDQLSLGAIVGLTTLLLTLAIVLVNFSDRVTIARGTIGGGGLILTMILIAVGATIYAVEQAQMGGASYKRVIAGKDLVADVLPPPLNIVEAYLETNIALNRPTEHQSFATRISALQQDYTARLAHWKSSKLIPEDIKQLIVSDSHHHAVRFWNEVNTSFLPALERQDAAAAASSHVELSAHFYGHRAVIDQIVKKANSYSERVEGSAVKKGEEMGRVALSTVLLLIFCIMAIMLALDKLVIRPLLGTATYLSDLVQGRWKEEAPFTVRHDEIGTIARSIETLRLASLEKQRLEKEAAEARKSRDTERAAEGLRLKLANEHITTLYDDLNLALQELQKAGDENIRKGKLAQLGQLTATVAHEIRNPLGAIKTAAYLVEHKVKDKNLGLAPALQRMNNAVKRCDQIITELLDFTRTKSIDATSQPLDEWIEDLVEEERRNLPAELSIVLELKTANQPIIFDTARMQRVLINFLSNGSEAMLGKNTDGNFEKTPNATLTITTRLVDGNVEIECSDNGPGILPENIAKIREPLFTTKSFGVGLGIPAVENILEQHDGGLRIESEPGQGATFTAWFPLRQPRTVEKPRDAKAA